MIPLWFRSGRAVAQAPPTLNPDRATPSAPSSPARVNSAYDALWQFATSSELFELLLLQRAAGLATIELTPKRFDTWGLASFQLRAVGQSSHLALRRTLLFGARTVALDSRDLLETLIPPDIAVAFADALRTTDLWQCARGQLDRLVTH